jgi:hypothetical protein
MIRRRKAAPDGTQAARGNRFVDIQGNSFLALAAAIAGLLIFKSTDFAVVAMTPRGDLQDNDTQFHGRGQINPNANPLLSRSLKRD